MKNTDIIPIEGNLALKQDFDTAVLNDIRRNRGNRFKLNLADKSLIEIMQSYKMFMSREHPNYSNDSAIAIIRNLEALDPSEGAFMPEDVCTEFWIQFKKFYLSVPGRNGKQRKPSGGQHYANLIAAALNWASKYGVRLDPSFHDYHFEHYEKKKVVPTDSQLSLIYYYDFDNPQVRKRLKRFAEEMNIQRYSIRVIKKVRDHFILSCSIGQRISDSKRIQGINFDSSKLNYETTQQKTGAHAKVNLQKCSIDYNIIQEILNRYNYRAPAYGMDTNVYNHMLHLLLRTIGGPFDELVVSENKINGVLVKETAPKWKLITSHTARRTFVTKEISRNIPIPQIMKETGHKDTRNLNRYYNPND